MGLTWPTHQVEMLMNPIQHHLEDPDLTPILLRNKSDGVRMATRRAHATRLRSAVVGADLRDAHPRALHRKLAPGLFERVELQRGASAGRRVVVHEELSALGLSEDAVFTLARRNTCAIPLEIGVRDLGGGARVFILGASTESDAAVAALELWRLVPGYQRSAQGVFLAVPIKGTALLFPLGPDPTDALCRAGLVGAVSADPLAAADPIASADAILRMTTLMHRTFPEPVSPHLYWCRREQHSMAVVPVPVQVRGGMPRICLVSPVREAVEAVYGSSAPRPSR